MNEVIHQRLLNWSEAVKGGLTMSGYCSVLGNLASESGGQSAHDYRIPFSITIEETEKAVQTLPDALKNIVLEFYMNDASTLDQKLKALEISKRTLYRRLDMAHGLILITVRS